MAAGRSETRSVCRPDSVPSSPRISRGRLGVAADRPRAATIEVVSASVPGTVAGYADACDVTTRRGTGTVRHRSQPAPWTGVHSTSVAGGRSVP